jgi:drug/metabolite transporter (DMT)-like permease
MHNDTAVVLGVTLLHEPFTLHTAAGALLIIGGSVFGLVRAAMRPKRQ